MDALAAGMLHAHMADAMCRAHAVPRGMMWVLLGERHCDMLWARFSRCMSFSLCLGLVVFSAPLRMGICVL